MPPPRPRERLPVVSRLLLVLAAAAAVAAGWIFWITWWMDFSQEPAPSDLMVVLAGNYSRGIHAADLYRRGYAPEVWISRPMPQADTELVRRLGIPYPREDDVTREVLAKRGVPREKIRIYGDGVNGTLEEARALQAALAKYPPGNAHPEALKILIVTSRPHARRSRRIFQRFFPQKNIRVSANAYEPFDRRWWTHKELALYAVLETAKVLYYLAGIRLITRP
ncbi:MAG: YdcF family protein [Elusimicrobia bacterium]|nr:YdcF family protein [Elusimicrobiota bacterium]